MSLREVVALQGIVLFILLAGFIAQGITFIRYITRMHLPPASNRPPEPPYEDPYEGPR